MADITVLLQEWLRGRPEALEQLLPHVYPELHSLASAYLRRRSIRLILRTPPAPTATAFGISIHADAGGKPVTATSVYSETIPLERVRQTLDSMRLARCGKPEPTAYGYYNYTAMLAAPFQAKAGTRYWLSVQAHVRERPGTNSFVFWGWISGPGDNKQSIQIPREDEPKSFPRDRAFTLIRKP